MILHSQDTCPMLFTDNTENHHVFWFDTYIFSAKKKKGVINDLCGSFKKIYF